MIKINLSTDGKKVGPEAYLRLIKLKFVILGLILMLVPDWIKSAYFEDQLNIAQTDMSTLTKERNELRKKVDGVKNIRNQIEKLKEREQSLQERLKVVKQIVETKKNPWNPVQYIAKNIPENVWLTSMIYNPEPGAGSMTLTGYSVDYKIQGEFQEALKQSIFFDKYIEYKKVTNSTTQTNSKEFAQFEFILKLVRLD
jgi:Tfp pilus assembly protein PilN